MIEAVIFELGGALIQFDLLEALACGQAAAGIRPGLAAADVTARYGQLRGLSRQERARQLVRQFDLRADTQHGPPTLTDWQLLLRLQAHAFEQLIGAPAILDAAGWPFRVALLYTARSMGCRVALVADLLSSQVDAILTGLALADSFDLVLSREDTTAGLADPELYLSIANEFDLAPNVCLSVNRLPVTMRAAILAGMVVLPITPGPALPSRLYAAIVAQQRDAGL